jgi:hypothetical protein
MLKMTTLKGACNPSKTKLKKWSRTHLKKTKRSHSLNLMSGGTEKPKE